MNPIHLKTRFKKFLSMLIRLMRYPGEEKVGDEGLEPSTTGLRVRCSTIELVTRTIFNYINFF